jgi:hypothetical protein
VRPVVISYNDVEYLEMDPDAYGNGEGEDVNGEMPIKT